MSLMSSPYLIRLQELKLWQGNYDNLLQKQQENSQECIDLSDIDSLDGVTPINESTTPRVSKDMNCVDLDRQVILPTTKPFNELLEDKLLDDQPYLPPAKRKQPFLKKGAGLARYKLTPNLKPYMSKTKSKITTPLNKNQDKDNLTSENLNQEEQSITPLKVPEVSIRCKAKWTKVDNGNEGFVKQQDETKFSSNYIIEKVNELFYRSNHCSGDSQAHNSSKYDKIEKEDLPENLCSDKSANELKLFEMLEEKANHSSFLSTNTSIVKLLTSTPSNNNSPKKVPVSEDSNLYQALKSNTSKLNKVLTSLKFSSQNKNGYCTDNQSRKSSESDSSCNEKTSILSSSFYSEFETTLRRNDVDKAVNTDFKSDVGCSNCIELESQIDKLQQKSSNLVSANSKLDQHVKELERQCDLLNSEMKRSRNDYEKDVEDLQKELEDERKKLAREKALVDMYIKDLRPKKKDSMEIENLKKELLEVKELLKLKETKNGTTQARLRNQIKQLEKDNSELKSSVEYWQKENAKLNAAQLVNRKAETRMLQQISRNLNRLTEETIKDVDNSNSPTSGKKENSKLRNREKGKNVAELKEKVVKGIQVQEDLPEQNNYDKRTNPPLEIIYNNDDLDKQCESSLGLVDKDQRDNLNLSRKVLTEQVFPDGSKEIKFANGTNKTISPDGNLIYFQYANGDFRETNHRNQTQKYYFASKSVWLTKHADGTQITEFPNGQKEEKFPDGKVHVNTIDGRILIKYPDGSEEINNPDGSRVVIRKEEKIIYLPNGQREIETPQFKKREYPDGSFKIIFPDGTQQSRYANGRVRIKDMTGTLIMDTNVEEMN
uniref:Centromere protein J isoform X1 n=1 Tax=Diabrotica virgifera virgifera TaxID=50390 RepID=A0A6P7GAM2_DIAVI